MEHSDHDYALLFKALSDATRVKIMGLLCDSELCACNLLEEVNITQPTLSYHMKILTECGMVHARRDKSWTYYKIDTQCIKDLQMFLHSIEVKNVNNNCKNC